MTEKKIAVIIPGYEPDFRFLKLLDELVTEAPGPVVLVDDGSGAGYKSIFEKAEKLAQQTGGCLLVHPENRGKGRALKTAFTYVVENMPDVIGAVTADADGQHSPECIRKVAEELLEHPDSLVLGVRTFGGEDVPRKSRLGNTVTAGIFKFVAGDRVSDTQTGLRGIPFRFMRELESVKGERFEFEMRMLLEASGRYPIREVPIETIYDSKEHHQTHYRPFRDSVKISLIFGERLLKYMFSSLSSAGVDLLLFQIFYALIMNVSSVLLPGTTILIATVAARVLSATYNYMINYHFVFRSRENVSRAAGKYLLLATGQMICSALLVSGFSRLLPAALAVAIKAVVDTGLFFISYSIQQKVVFQRN